MNTSKTSELNALRKLVNLWHTTKSRKTKATLMRRISRANDRFFARWKCDGVARLARERAR